MNRAIAFGCAAALATGLGAAAQVGGLSLQGAMPAFGPAEVARGKAAFADNCASCHGGDLAGGQFGPTLKGPVFEAHWRGKAAQDLLEYISTRMPPGAPGSLGPSAYTDLEALILSENRSGTASTSTKPAREEVEAPPQAANDPEHAGPSAGGIDPGLAAATAPRRARLAGIRPVSDAMLRTPAAEDWLLWRGDYGSLGFSRLAKINKHNVRNLREAWSWALPPSQNEIAPLVHDGVLFIQSGGATVQAFDAATGDLLWQYVRQLPAEFNNGRASRVKAIGIYGAKLYVPTADGHLVALDVKTGKLVWDHAVLTDAQASSKGQAEGVALHLDGGPVIARGKVIIGVSLGIKNGAGGCFIVALDAETGAETWRFNTVARPGEPGGNSWNGASLNERFGASIWTAGSYDPDLNLVYFGTGNTYDVGTLLEPHGGAGDTSDGLYTDSTIALNPDTGKLVWHFQHVKRDVWDLDWAFEQSLVTVNVNGKPRKLVVTGGKIALFDALDRATGKFVRAHDFGLQNLVVNVDPKSGDKTINPAVQPDADKPKMLCPSPLGARNWPATAVNPTTKILYVPMVEFCTDYTYSPRSAAEIAAGGQDIHFGMRLRPDVDGKFGRVAAVDLQTGRTLWTQRRRAPIASSLLATAGGLLFTGDRDRRFRALDDATGKVLWETRLSASPNSTPVTYSVNGEQYVAVVSGGGGPFDGGTSSVATEIFSPGGATTLHVFKLPVGAAPR